MKGDGKGLLAVALSMGVLLLWYRFVVPTPQQKMQTQSQSQGGQTSVPPPNSASKIELPPIQAPISKSQQGKKVLLENKWVQVTFDTLDASISEWKLKNYTRNGESNDESKKLVSVIEPEGSVLSLQLEEEGTRIADFPPFDVVNHGENEISLRSQSKNFTLWKRAKLLENSYQLEVEVEIINHSKETRSLSPSVLWGKMAKEETPQRGVLFFKTPPDRWHPIWYQDGIKTTPFEKVPATQVLEGKMSWIGAESQYFIGGVIPLENQGLRIAMGKQSVDGKDPLFFQQLVFSNIQILPREHWLQKFQVYGGPKILGELNKVGHGFDQSIGYGWTRLIALPILYLLQFFYRFVQNYGISIILLTIFIKMLLHPVNKKSLASMKKMQALQPKLKELQKKYANDRQKLNLEMMQLFKSNKVNPMGGCLPMLLQFPIYIALYKVLWSSVELYHTPFFWFYKDLSAPDPYLIVPIVLGIAMFVQTKMTPQPGADPAQQKMMLIMPLIFSVFMVFLPLGLGIYILVNTLMTILQQWMVHRGIRFRDLIRGKVTLNGQTS